MSLRILAKPASPLSMGPGEGNWTLCGTPRSDQPIKSSFLSECDGFTGTNVGRVLS